MQSAVRTRCREPTSSKKNRQNENKHCKNIHPELIGLSGISLNQAQFVDLINTQTQRQKIGHCESQMMLATNVLGLPSSMLGLITR